MKAKFIAQAQCVLRTTAISSNFQVRPYDDISGNIPMQTPSVRIDKLPTLTTAQRKQILVVIGGWGGQPDSDPPNAHPPGSSPYNCAATKFCTNGIQILTVGEHAREVRLVLLRLVCAIH